MPQFRSSRSLGAGRGRVGRRALEKAAADSPPKLAPGTDSVACRREHRGPVELRAHGVLIAAVVVDPPCDRLVSYLGVKLDAPPGRCGQSKGLQTGRAACQAHNVRRRRDLVAVPLEAVEALRQRPEYRVAVSHGGELDGYPADLGRGGSFGAAPGDLGQELRSQADA